MSEQAYCARYQADCDELVALRASHKRLRKALEGAIPALQTAFEEMMNEETAEDLAKARAAIAEAKGVGR